MPRAASPLTITVIEHAIRRAIVRNHVPVPATGQRPRTRDFTLWDGHGLHLGDRAGSHCWRLKYTRPDARENRVALGMYPDVSPAKARDAAAKARLALIAGIDPRAARKAAAAERKRAATATFERFALAWMRNKAPGWADQTRRRAELVVKRYLIVAIGERDARDPTSADVLRVLRRINGHAPALTKKAAGASGFPMATPPRTCASTAAPCTFIRASLPCCRW